MNASAIALLQALQQGHSYPKELMDTVNLGKTQFHDLIKADYAANLYRPRIEHFRKLTFSDKA